MPKNNPSFVCLQVSKECLLCRVSILAPCFLSQDIPLTQDLPFTLTRDRTPTTPCCSTRHHMHTLPSRFSPRD